MKNINLLLIKESDRKNSMLKRIKTTIKSLLPYKIYQSLKSINKYFVKNLKYDSPLFRNDDVAYDTDVIDFKRFCTIFHKYGFVQLHGITLYGRCNCSFVCNGIPTMYESINPYDRYDYDVCKKVSTCYIGDNTELIDYINSIPDKIALHGLYHSNYEAMSYKKQETDIEKGLDLLHKLFPRKEVNIFIAPFNKTNPNTYEICKKFGLSVSAENGRHLEEMIHNNTKINKNCETYRYHHHRFYQSSTFFYYDLSMAKLDNYLRNNFLFTEKPMPSMDLFESVINSFGVSKWHNYAFKEFDSRKHAKLAIEWICKNVNHEAKILEVGCGAAVNLFHLHSTGFKNLSGYDIDNKAVSAAMTINNLIDGNIYIYNDDSRTPKLSTMQDIIFWINGLYHLDDYSLEDFFYTHSHFIKNGGYIIFDMIDSKFNSIEGNQYCSQDLQLPVNQRRKSEYKIRMDCNQIKEILSKYNFRIFKKFELIKEKIPRYIYICKRNK